MEEKKRYTKIIIIVFLASFVLALCATIYILYTMHKTINKDEGQEAQIEEVVQDGKSKLGEILVDGKISYLNWLMWEFFDEYGTETDIDFAGKNIFGNTNNGQEFLDTKEKKLKMAIIYAYYSDYDLILKDEIIDARLGIPGGTGGRAVYLDSLKAMYKDLFNEELNWLPSCSGGTYYYCVYNNFYMFSEWSGTPEINYSKLSFDSLTINGNEYTLVLKINTVEGRFDNYNYKDSGSKLIIKSVKSKDQHGNEYFSNISMTYNK